MNIRIIVAAHKPYRMPEDSIYLPVQVGAEGKAPIGFQRDCTGDHISAKNPHYRDLPYVFMERQNWLTKGGRFVMRKLRGSK